MALDDPDIDLAFQEVGGKAVPERVQACLLVDRGRRLGKMQQAAQLPRGQGIDPTSPRTIWACRS
jgi:hypothetical protein